MMENENILETLKEINQKFSQKEIDYWVFGGVAIAGYKGGFYRQHGDIDIFVWRSDEDKIKEVLEPLGYNLRSYPHKLFAQHLYGKHIDFVYMSMEDDKVRFRFAQDIPPAFPKNYFSSDEVLLNEVKFRVISKELAYILKFRFVNFFKRDPRHSRVKERGEMDLKEIGKLLKDNGASEGKIRKLEQGYG